MFLENRVLRQIFRPKRDAIKAYLRGLHNEELNEVYTSPHVFQMGKSKRTKWTGHVTRMGERRGAYWVLLGKPEGNRPLERPRHR
jgi:hypothetical protein